MVCIGSIAPSYESSGLTNPRIAQEMVKAADDAVDAHHFVPESMHESVFGHRRFTLYVTVRDGYTINS